MTKAIAKDGTANLRDARPVYQDIIPFRCEADGARLRWCRRDATRLLVIRQGDGYSYRLRLCAFHANRLAAVNSWRTSIGEEYTVESCTEIVSPVPISNVNTVMENT